MDNLIEEGIEDRVLGVELEMQEFVEDEIAEVKDKIIKHFEDGRVTLQFEHTWLPPTDNVRNPAKDTPGPCFYDSPILPPK